jgi:hypothetical protein
VTRAAENTLEITVADTSQPDSLQLLNGQGATTAQFKFNKPCKYPLPPVVSLGSKRLG